LTPGDILAAEQLECLESILGIVAETRQDLLQLMDAVSPLLNNPAARFLRKRKANG
jgi:hypothetical protein